MGKKERMGSGGFGSIGGREVGREGRIEERKDVRREGRGGRREDVEGGKDGE